MVYEHGRRSAPSEDVTGRRVEATPAVEVVSHGPSGYPSSVTKRAIDPSDPRAPPQEVWDRMSDEERAAVVEALPSLVPFELHPPEGDKHVRAKDGVASALQEFFRRVGRRIYVTKELATYYPDEPLFCPDVLAVRDVEPHGREKWVVSAEKKGLDFVLEVHVRGSKKKDFDINVKRYARLGIPEYFAFDRERMRLAAWRLPEPTARVYVPIVPQAGRYSSSVLEIDLALEKDRVRFYYGTAPLADAEELVLRLERMVDDVTGRAEQEAERAQQEAERAEQGARRIADLEAKLAAALAEIETLRSR
jgi:Uma2 family endonuclease